MGNFTFNKEKHIKCILDNFDFGKVHDTMLALNWQWAFSGVPSIDELKKTAKRLLTDVYNKDYCSISTGGFKASKQDDYLELQFIISDWNSDFINTGPEYEKMKKLKIRTKKLNTIQNLTEDENY